MGGLKQYAWLRPLAHLGVACVNLLCYGADRLVPHPRLASDYLGILTLDNANRAVSALSTGIGD